MSSICLSIDFEPTYLEIPFSENMLEKSFLDDYMVIFYSDINRKILHSAAVEKRTKERADYESNFFKPIGDKEYCATWPLGKIGNQWIITGRVGQKRVEARFSSEDKNNFSRSSAFSRLIEIDRHLKLLDFWLTEEDWRNKAGFIGTQLVSYSLDGQRWLPLWANAQDCEKAFLTMMNKKDGTRKDLRFMLYSLFSNDYMLERFEELSLKMVDKYSLY